MTTSETRHRSIWADLQGVPFEQGYLNAGGVKTRYLRAGTRGAPPLIFLHGTGGHAEAYVRNLGAHSAHFDTYAIDMLGHGLTEKPAYDYTIPRYLEHLNAFMDAANLKRASLSGESLGGWVASHFAVNHPERVDKLVLNTAGGDRIDPTALARLRELTLQAADDPSWERLKTRLEWLMYDKSDVHDDLIGSRQAIYQMPIMKQGIRRILVLHTIEARQKYALKDSDWANIKHPTLVLWTDHDPTAKVEVGEKLASMIPGAKFVVMKDCGHWPQFEDADTFNRIHIEFLLGRPQ